MNDVLADKPASTPAAQWREAGEPDPHRDRYNCERAALALGHLTDDELANAVFMHGDSPLNVDAVLRGEPSGHTYLVAAKDRIRWLSRQLVEATANGGPLNSERWTLEALIEQLEKWRAIASGRTCVSFESLCFGASSLWHQTHRENFRAIDRKPEALSRWILDREKSVSSDFPQQVLTLLERQAAEIQRQGALLAEAERLCMEHCPGETSKELRDDWVAHQVARVSDAGALPERSNG